MMALYRIVEPSGGRIIIDGCDTSQIGLTDLRSRLALVPQVCADCFLEDLPVRAPYHFSAAASSHILNLEIQDAFSSSVLLQ